MTIYGMDIRKGKAFSIMNEHGSIDLVVNKVHAKQSSIYVGLELEGRSNTHLLRINSSLEPTSIMKGVSVQVPLRYQRYRDGTIKSTIAYLDFSYDVPTHIRRKKSEAGELMDLRNYEGPAPEFEMPVPETPLINHEEGPRAFMFLYQQYDQTTQ